MPAKRKPVPPAETFADLLDAVAPGEGWAAFARRAGVSSRTVWRLRRGEGIEPYRGTLHALAQALNVPEARVRAAIEASRAATGKG